MNATLPPPAAIDPTETTVTVRGINPARLSDETLRTLQITTEPRDTNGDALREWLRTQVIAELGRRVANADPAASVPLESPAWALPWHTFDDEGLAAALGTTYSWCGMDVDGETAAVLGRVHEAVVVACATRLRELHDAIERGRVRRGN